MRKSTALVVLVLVFFGLAPSARAQQRFPADPEQYRQTITDRIESTWQRMEKKLDRHKVSKERKEAIRRSFDEAVAGINEAIDKASADGQISRGEAYRINTMTSGLRGKVRGKLAVDRAAQRAAGGPRPGGAGRAAPSTPAAKDNPATESDAGEGRPARSTSSSPKHRPPRKRAPSPHARAASS